MFTHRLAAHRQDGFTLVELLVLIGLFAIVGGLSIAFFLSTITGRARAQAHIETQEQARLAMQRIVFEIRRARDTEGTSDFGVNLAMNPGTTLDLDMADAGTDPTTFAVTGGILTITQGVGGAVELTSDDVQVTNLTFTERTTGNGRSKHIQVLLNVSHPDPTATDALDIDYLLRTSVELRDR